MAGNGVFSVAGSETASATTDGVGPTKGVGGPPMKSMSRHHGGGRWVAVVENRPPHRIGSGQRLDRLGLKTGSGFGGRRRLQPDFPHQHDRRAAPRRPAPGSAIPARRTTGTTLSGARALGPRRVRRGDSLRRRMMGGLALGHGVDAVLQQVEQIGELGGLGQRAGGIDVGAGEADGDQQHVQLVAQLRQRGAVGAHQRLQAVERGEQHLRVGVAVAPGIFGEEGMAARARGQRRVERLEIVLAG